MIHIRVNLSPNPTPDHDLDNGPTTYSLRTTLSSIFLPILFLTAIVVEIVLADQLLACPSIASEYFCGCLKRLPLQGCRRDRYKRLSDQTAIQHSQIEVAITVCGTRNRVAEGRSYVFRYVLLLWPRCWTLFIWNVFLIVSRRIQTGRNFCEVSHSNIHSKLGASLF